MLLTFAAKTPAWGPYALAKVDGGHGRLTPGIHQWKAMMKHPNKEATHKRSRVSISMRLMKQFLLDRNKPNTGTVNAQIT
jgi:hypothetical protein